MTNVCFAEAIKLGHGIGDRSGDHGVMPLRWKSFRFQRIDDKVKDD